MDVMKTGGIAMVFHPGIIMSVFTPVNGINWQAVVPMSHCHHLCNASDHTSARLASLHWPPKGALWFRRCAFLN